MELFTNEHIFLRRLNIRELSYLHKTPCLLTSTKSTHKITINKDTLINIDLIKSLVEKESFEFSYSKKITLLFQINLLITSLKFQKNFQQVHESKI